MRPEAKHKGAAASPGRFEFRFGPAPAYGHLEKIWSDLEHRASPSFFTSWTWVGCEFEARFSEPYLLRVSDGEELVGLALFNRHRRLFRFPTFYLGASGQAESDSVFVEHNGPLLVRPTPEMTSDVFRHLLGFIARGRLGALVECPGAAEHVYQGAQAAGATFNVVERIAPYRDLVALRMQGGELVSTLSANSRYQLRRSQRSYEQSGTLRVERAQSETEAFEFLRSLVVLHQARWRRRGRIGAFSPNTMPFHMALVARGMPRGEIDLLRISAGERVLGYLFNFIKSNVVHNYQCGFDYDNAAAHEKPGLTSHLMAIQYYLHRGQIERYDFLAGEDRYKRTLSDKFVPLVWFQLAVSSASLATLSYRAKARIRESGLLSLLGGEHIKDKS